MNGVRNCYPVVQPCSPSINSVTGCPGQALTIPFEITNDGEQNCPDTYSYDIVVLSGGQQIGKNNGETLDSDSTGSLPKGQTYNGSIVVTVANNADFGGTCNYKLRVWNSTGSAASPTCSLTGTLTVKSCACQILNFQNVVSCPGAPANVSFKIKNGTECTTPFFYEVVKTQGTLSVTGLPKTGTTSSLQPNSEETVQFSVTLGSTQGATATIEARVRCRDNTQPQCATQTATLTSYGATLKSIKFTSDHGQLKDNDEDWTDTGTVYSEPEWVAATATNNPISQTKNTSLGIDVVIQVTPSGAHFDLMGDGAQNYVDFSSSGNTSTGADQTLSVTANAALPNMVTTLPESIAWKVKMTDPDPDCEISLGSSGSHLIYVTYGTPAGSVVTEMRVGFVCGAADGQSTLRACADAVFDSLGGSFDLSGEMWGPVPIWLLHDEGEISQCPGLAMFVNVHFQMLGLGSGSYRFCRAKSDGTYEAATSPVGTVWRTIVPGVGHPDPTSHDNDYGSERLQMIDGNGNGNNYEATCFFDGNHYALGVGRGHVTAQQVVNAAFTDVAWQYRTGTGPYVFHKCTEDPWAPAP